jgi:hypothetical protein
VPLAAVENAAGSRGGLKMKRTLFALVAAAFVTVVSASRPVQADVDVHIGIGIPPPPVITFQAEPQVVLVPETRVYYVPQVVNYDMYRYGSYWYVNQGGYWYRSRGYSGPFSVVEYGRVPQQIVTVPVKYRHHPRKPHSKGHGRGKH